MYAKEKCKYNNRLKSEDNTIIEQVRMKDKKKCIGDFSLGKTIGEGNFGKVKIGMHSITGEKVIFLYLIL